MRPHLPRRCSRRRQLGGVTRQVLRFGVEQKRETEEKGGEDCKFHRVERSTSFASRAMRFPDNADMSQVAANVEHGVLKICIKKRAEAQGRRIALS